MKARLLPRASLPAFSSAGGRERPSLAHTSGGGSRKDEGFSESSSTTERKGAYSALSLGGAEACGF